MELIAYARAHFFVLTSDNKMQEPTAQWYLQEQIRNRMFHAKGPSPCCML